MSNTAFTLHQKLGWLGWKSGQPSYNSPCKHNHASQAMPSQYTSISWTAWVGTGSFAGVNITVLCSWATHEQKVMPLSLGEQWHNTWIKSWQSWLQYGERRRYNRSSKGISKISNQSNLKGNCNVFDKIAREMWERWATRGEVSNAPRRSRNSNITLQPNTVMAFLCESH